MGWKQEQNSMNEGLTIKRDAGNEYKNLTCKESVRTSYSGQKKSIQNETIVT